MKRKFEVLGFRKLGKFENRGFTVPVSYTSGGGHRPEVVTEGWCTEAVANQPSGGIDGGSGYGLQGWISFCFVFATWLI